jgi:hypothetical protein
MFMHHDHAKAEIANRLHHAENRRSAERARAQQSGPRWQRRRNN